jgi:hypothetical protein
MELPRTNSLQVYLTKLTDIVKQAQQNACWAPRVNSHSASRLLLSPWELTESSQFCCHYTTHKKVANHSSWNKTPPWDKQLSSKDIWSGDFHVLSNRFKHLHRGHFRSATLMHMTDACWTEFKNNVVLGSACTGLYGRQWTHGGGNQPGSSFSWTHSLGSSYDSG